MIWRNAPPIQRISVSILQSKRIRCMTSPSSPITNIRLLKAGVCCVKSYVSKCTHRWVRILGVGTFCRKRNVITSSETYLPVGTFRNVPTGGYVSKRNFLHNRPLAYPQMADRYRYQFHKSKAKNYRLALCAISMSEANVQTVIAARSGAWSSANLTANWDGLIGDERGINFIIYSLHISKLIRLN